MSDKNGGKDSMKEMQKKTMKAIKGGTHRKDGPRCMYTPDPNRLSKGKFKGTS